MITEGEHRTAPREWQLPRTWPTAKGEIMVDTTNVHRTTRHDRCNHDFIDLLAKDFGFPRYALVNAFIGMPAGTQEGSYHLV